MTPIEHWICQACEDSYATEAAALACHPPWHAWECGECGDTWGTLPEAERCCVDTETGAERYLADRLKDPAYEQAYNAAKGAIPEAHRTKDGDR